MRRTLCTAVLILASLFHSAPAGAQVFTNKEVGKTGRAIADSLSHTPYPYVLPIWGAKAQKLGFTLPLPAGLSVQYFGQRSDIVIENLMVGFNNGPLYNLDGLVRFDETRASSDGLSLRPDVWVFPFLNVYGIFGYSSASTKVDYGIWLPDSSGNEHKVVSLSSKVDFNATTFGFGLTPTLGVGGGWMAFDMNFTWTDVPQLDKPASAFVFDPRMGKSFRLGRPDQNVNVWVGGFRLKINTGTTGSIPLSEVLPVDQWQSGIQQGIDQVAKLNAEVDAWWNSLTPEQQANPVNRARYDTSKAALARAGSALSGAQTAVGNAASSTVQYSIDKRPADMWNFMVGGQFQLSKMWMFRAEVGFLGSRTHAIAGAQYRFGF